MKKGFIWIIGLVVLIGFCLVIALIIRTLIVGPYEQAQQRWQQMGGQRYTLIVSEVCFCPYTGDIKLTVQQGYVTNVEPLSGELGAPSNLSSFSRLTVDSMLAQAGSRQMDLLLSPWFTTLSIDYDPVYGYVSRYSSDANGIVTGYYITDTGYLYTARDLQLTAP